MPERYLSYLAEVLDVSSVGASPPIVEFALRRDAEVFRKNNEDGITNDMLNLFGAFIGSHGRFRR